MLRKICKFERKPQINLEKPRIFSKFYILSSKFSIWHKNVSFFFINNFFLLKNLFKVALQYLFNVFILFNTVSYFKINFKLKYNQKCFLKKTWKKNWIPELKTIDLCVFKFFFINSLIQKLLIIFIISLTTIFFWLICSNILILPII